MNTRFYKFLERAVEKRIQCDNIGVPISGGLDSTLIVKIICKIDDHNRFYFLNIGRKNKWTQMISDNYGIKIHYSQPVIPPKFLEECVWIWEEPFYAYSANYFLYKQMKKNGKNVSISGLGADELFGGYDYYGTNRYPRGLFRVIHAPLDGEKRIQDNYLLRLHHLRKNDKMGLWFGVEGRYPYLDLQDFRETNKMSIKKILSEDFPSDFINRKKEGFRLKEIDDPKAMYTEQLKIWRKLFL